MTERNEKIKLVTHEQAKDEKNRYEKSFYYISCFGGCERRLKITFISLLNKHMKSEVIAQAHTYSSNKSMANTKIFTLPHSWQFNFLNYSFFIFVSVEYFFMRKKTLFTLCCCEKNSDENGKVVRVECWVRYCCCCYPICKRSWVTKNIHNMSESSRWSNEKL